MAAQLCLPLRREREGEELFAHFIPHTGLFPTDPTSWEWMSSQSPSKPSLNFINNKMKAQRG